MRKQQRSSSSPNDRNNPSIRWTRMLNLLDYHRWHYVKKVLANKKHAQGKNSGGDEMDALYCNIHGVCVMKDADVPRIEGKAADQFSSLSKGPSDASSPRTKKSPASRIRKMIAKEVTKRRGRHRRSSTCPATTELLTNQSPHPLVSQHKQQTDEMILDNHGCAPDNADETNEKCELCSTMKIRCHLGSKKQFDENGILQGNTGNGLLLLNNDESSSKNQQLGRSVSFYHQPRELMDAMDVLTMNKQFFLRILEDPGSSLRHHFLAQQASYRMKGLTKSGTFPIRDSSNNNAGSNPSLLKNKRKMNSKEMNQNQSSLVSPLPMVNGHENQVKRRRFKSLRQKIKHLIKESRKERHRITMDAVLHKVPYGQNSPRVSVESTPTHNSPCSKEHKPRRRSPSLDGSLDRYCHLFETSFSKEIQPHLSERLKLRDDNESSATGSTRRSLGRIFSSPDLEFYRECRMSDFRNHSFNDLKAQRMLVGVECETQLDGTAKVGTQEVEAAEPNDQVGTSSEASSEESAIEDQISPSLQNSSAVKMASFGLTRTSAISTLMEPCSISMLDPDLHKDLLGPENLLVSEDSTTKLGDLVSANEDYSTFIQQLEVLSVNSPTLDYKLKTDTDEPGASLERLASTLLHRVHVDTKDEAEFNYVRDILHLSGYSENQLLGMWYSAEQPVDPSVFVEVESSSLLEPACSSPEYRSQCNRLLLFDLINEVLLSIYESSVSYWPATLSSCSRIHPMPKGYRVLEEVWACISWYLGSRPELAPSLDYVTARDLAQDNGWMNLQFDAECVGLELEKLIFEDLLGEVILS